MFTYFVNNVSGDNMLISIIRTIILYVFIIFAVRLMGKRQISDMQPSELVVTLVVAEVASIPMENTGQPMLSGIIPVLVLVSLEIIMSVLMMKSGKFHKLVCGKPVLVISDGEILQNEMRRLRITTEDLCVQLRQQNIFSLESVQYCIIETNGQVSVLEKPENRIPEAKDFNISIKDNKIETVVVNDGKILDNSLKLCCQDKNKVYSILKDERTKISDVFIMTLDALGNYNIILKEMKK